MNTLQHLSGVYEKKEKQKRGKGGGKNPEARSQKPESLRAKHNLAN
jgi:hypothetical protein